MCELHVHGVQIPILVEFKVWRSTLGCALEMRMPFTGQPHSQEEQMVKDYIKTQ